MNIRVEKFIASKFIELAVDSDSGAYLLGIPFDYGGSGHTRYYELSDEEFNDCLENEDSVDKYWSNGIFNGSGESYYSTFSADNIDDKTMNPYLTKSGLKKAASTFYNWIRRH